jgi:type VI secretion system secreted protein VgrG
MAARTFILHTPLDDDALKFRKMDATEALSDIGHYNIQVASSSPDVDPTDLLGEGMTLEVINQYGSSRYINGIVVSFMYIGPDGSAAKSYLYQVRMHSWLFLAERQSDCRNKYPPAKPGVL